MRVMTICVGLVIAAVSLQCTGVSPGVEDGASILGPWGGRHVSLAVTASGGTVEYDCAHGSLTAPIRPAADGRFETAGIHVREHGGPVREGEVPDSVPARYAGRITGDRMTLRVVVGADTLGPFELRRAAAPILLKCL